MRAFVALFLGAALGERVAARTRAALGPAARGSRLPRADGLHLTLFFLGPTGAATAAALERELGAPAGPASRPAPALRLGATGAFPRWRDARVLWVGVDEEPGTRGRLAALRSGVLDALERAGVDVAAERARPFRAHVTVGRPRRPGAAGDAHAAFRALALELPWRPRALHLAESVAQADGPPRYVPRAAFPFSG